MLVITVAFVGHNPRTITSSYGFEVLLISDSCYPVIFLVFNDGLCIWKLYNNILTINYSLLYLIYFNIYHVVALSESKAQARFERLKALPGSIFDHHGGAYLSQTNLYTPI
jgi:hypothetical protein